MGNTKRNVGFRPYGQVLRATQYIANGAVYPGDLVYHGSSGNVITYASSAIPIVGVAASYGSGQGSQILVWDHPDQQFIVQSDGGTPANQSDMFYNYQVTATGGSSQYKVSRMTLTGSSQGTISTMPLKAVFIDPRGDNVLGTYADVVVVINNHVFKGGTGSVGV
jgi:hypothetical protein